MSRPTKIHYGYRPFSIHYVKSKDIDDCMGEFDHETHTISIAEDTASAEQGNTLLHEFLHMVTHQSAMFEGVPGKKAVDERLARVIANAVHELIVRNPVAFDWMVDRMRTGSYVCPKAIENIDKPK